VECRNFKYCANKVPKWILTIQQNMCIHCLTKIGPLEFLDEIKECFVCFDIKKVVKVRCGHTFCLECWINWSKVQDKILDCPLCRKTIF
jgi:hypothetical protein